MPSDHQNDIVTFLPQWRDAGDEKITFRAAEDYTGGGSLDVVACLGLPFNPIQRVSLKMIETVNGKSVGIKPANTGANDA